MFFKVFKSFNKSIIEQCQYYCGYLPFYYYYSVKRLKFLTAVKNGSFSRVQFLLEWVGAGEFDVLLADLDLKQPLLTSATVYLTIAGQLGISFQVPWRS